MFKKVSFVVCAVTLLAVCRQADAHRYWYYGGCADPCVRVIAKPCAPVACAPAPCAPAKPAATPIVVPMDAFTIKMVPVYETVDKYVCVNAVKEETRLRPVTVSRKVPVEEQRVRTKIVWDTVEKTKVIDYSVMVPVVSDHVKEYSVTVPVWTDHEDTYTIKEPVLIDVEQKYTIQEPVLKQVPFTFHVQVPYPITETRFRTVVNAIPVVKTRHITHCVPVNTISKVGKDFGHWENRVVEVATHHCSWGCGGWGCRGCQRVCKTVCKKVWCPNVVYEDSPGICHKSQTQPLNFLVYEQHATKVPYECTSVAFRSEPRQGTKTVVSYKCVTLTRTVKDVKYVDVVRTRPKKVLTYAEEPRTENFQTVAYEKVMKQKEVVYTEKVPREEVEHFTVTRYDTVCEKKLVPYTVQVPIPAVKKTQVQLCRMVPKLVPITIKPCESCVGCAPACGTPCVKCCH